MSAGDAQEVCREDPALRELVTFSHGLTPSVRVRIVVLVRGG